DVDAGAFLDLGVAVVEVLVQGSREPAADGCLARTHRPDQIDVPLAAHRPQSVVASPGRWHERLKKNGSKKKKAGVKPAFVRAMKRCSDAVRGRRRVALTVRAERAVHAGRRDVLVLEVACEAVE